MKAIILAAGEGTRLRPLTNTIPKPLIKICGKTILEHNLEIMYKYLDEIIIIVKYKKEKIQEHLGNNYKGVKIVYKEQGEDKGTGAAIRGLQSDTDVIIINGDTIFDKKDVEKLINYAGFGVLIKKVNDPEKYGIFKLDYRGYIKEIIEKPKEYVGNLANLGMYKFDAKIIEFAENIRISARGEYEITDAINDFAKLFPFVPFEIQGEFIDVGYPWDILTSNAHLLKELSKSEIRGTVEDGVNIKGNIILEEGAVLKSGTYIEGNVFIGKNSIIGPNTYLRGSTVIGENCKIGNAVELKNTCIGDNSNVAHLSYIGDSIIGNNVNIGGGFITANLRHDNGSIKIPVKGELVDSGLHKFGIIIGDNCKLGINSSSMPGRVLENNTFTNPGTIIK
ncbi:MAG: sugar phosphate nucleotidyltransferase [Candidatus Gracilibacteria bacterium]|nr:sugar phosphate nucleotidyltransferase [Candidatus Gracilibacteria bacterium]